MLVFLIFHGERKICDHLGGIVDAEDGRIDGEGIIFIAAPFLTGIEIIVGRTSVIDFIHHIHGFIFWQLFAFHDTADTAFFIGVNENAEHTGVTAEYIVGAATDENGVFTFGDFTDELGLEKEELIIEWHMIAKRGVHPIGTGAHSEGIEQAAGGGFIDAAQSLLAHIALFGGHGNEFTSVDFTAEQFAEAHTDLPAAASMLTSNSNNQMLRHRNLLAYENRSVYIIHYSTKEQRCKEFFCKR